MASVHLVGSLVGSCLHCPCLLQVMLPPGARGTISYIAPAGEYTVNDEVIEIEFQVCPGLPVLLHLGARYAVCALLLRPP